MAYALLARVLARNFTEDGIFENWAKKNVAEVLQLNNTGGTFLNFARTI